MRTRSGYVYVYESEEEQEAERVRTYARFLNWKAEINRRFKRITGFDLDDVRDLPYYLYFDEGINQQTVLEIALRNML